MAETNNRRLAVNLLMGILFCDFVMLDLLSGFDSYNIRDASSGPLRLSFYFVLVLVSTLFYCVSSLCAERIRKSLAVR
jgi:hypothetical protein